MRYLLFWAIYPFIWADAGIITWVFVKSECLLSLCVNLDWLVGLVPSVAGLLGCCVLSHQQRGQRVAQWVAGSGAARRRESGMAAQTARAILGADLSRARWGCQGRLSWRCQGLAWNGSASAGGRLGRRRRGGKECRGRRQRPTPGADAGEAAWGAGAGADLEGGAGAGRNAGADARGRRRGGRLGRKCRGRLGRRRRGGKECRGRLALVTLHSVGCWPTSFSTIKYSRLLI